MQYVTISRYWNNPQIKIEITEEEIELKIHIDDFKEAVKQEVGSVLTVFTKAGISQKIDKAFEAIIEGVKEESAKVIGIK